MSDWLDAHAMADGQLDVSRLSEDPTMVAEYEAVVSLKSALSKIEKPSTESAWKSCVGRLNELDRASRVESFVGRYAWQMCSVFLVMIVGAAIMNRNNPAPRLGAGDLAYMASSLSPMSGASSNPQRYLEEFGEVKPSIRPEALTVLGAANGFIDGVPAVRWELRDNAGQLTLIAIRAEKVDGCQELSSGSCYKTTRIGSGNVVIWNGDGYSVALIGDRSPEELAAVADQIRK